MERSLKTPARGVTVIEVLIMISVIAVLIVFAAPMVGSAFSTTEVDEAVRITEKSVREARALARLYRTDVYVKIESSDDRAPSITVSMPGRHQHVDVGQRKEEFALPGQVQVLSGDAMLQFNPEGEVDLPAMVMLASRVDQRDFQRLVIE